MYIQKVKEMPKREILIQSKIEPELVDHIKQQPNFEFIGMSGYIRRALVKVTRFKGDLNKSYKLRNKKVKI